MQQEIITQPDTAKLTVKQKATAVAKSGAKWAFWYTVAQLALEVARLVFHK